MAVQVLIKGIQWKGREHESDYSKSGKVDGVHDG